MRALLFVVALAGCIEPNLLVCEDGTACPAGKVCLPSGGCGDVQDVAACDGRANGDLCTATFGEGRCRAGACRPSRCGDGIVDPGEVCDDGNTENGDGCSGSCLSNETCGNGISELNEACDCGDADHPGGALCAGTYNGGAICRTDCTLARCGNGQPDPMEVCDDGNVKSGDGCNATCTSDETCGNAIVDVNEQCDDGNLDENDACEPTCQTPRCGDNIVDHGEVCDDGNNTPGDGCSFDCLSKEVCGNSITDFFAGEGCDDGTNHILHDGCSDTCAVEQTVWETATVPTPPSGRHAHAMAFVIDRHSIVMFGGATGALFESSYGVMHPYGDTWEWDPTARHWTDRTSPGPSARYGHAMAYDSTRKKLVLFGGFSGSTPATMQTLGDTWEWDPVTLQWTQRTPMTSPPARGLHAMAFDGGRSRVVLFGGGTAATIGSASCGYLPAATFTDTWEWDGTNWTQRTPSTSPPARIAASMTFDQTHARTVLAGGLGNGDTGTWEWDGTSWTQRAATNPPTAFGYGLGYDPVHDELALFGGESWYTSGCGIDTAQNWTITQNRATGQWSSESPATSPSSRSFTAAAYDTDVAKLIVFGGQYLQSYTGSGQKEFNEVWNWDGTNWTLAVPQTPPQLRYAAVAYDSARQQLVVFGGVRDLGSEHAVNETWIWDGATWTQRFPAQSPTPRTGAAMTYDARRERIVLFGGGDTGGGSVYVTSETWEWDGNTWTKRVTSTTPAARAGHAMTYDAAHGNVVMFGGASSVVGSESASSMYNDTWVYNGNDWLQLTPSTSPSARYQHAMAYDAKRQRVVLFGGSTVVDQNTGRTDVGDTWEWNGTTWTQRSSTGPSARDRHVLVDDPVGLGVVLFGGRVSHGVSGDLPLDVWRWDGAAGAWTQIPSVDLPPARYGHVGAYDGARHRIVIAFGTDDNAELIDTWTLRSAVVGALAPRDDDCSGGSDLDNDGLYGCADPDCWSWCTPACPPNTSCPLAPRCGDNVCTSPRENHARCPADCP